MGDATQEAVDAFYWQHGPCCAGCDWWRHSNSRAGECTRSVPTGGDRATLLGIYNTSMDFGAGHIFTPREHRCGEFKDTFDWTALPLPYLKRIGYDASAAGEGR